MASLIYANGKLWAAVGILATHPGRIQERLVKACHESLVLVPEPVLPSYCRPIYKRVWQSVTSSGRCCTALAESEIRLWWWPRYVRA